MLAVEEDSECSDDEDRECSVRVKPESCLKGNYREGAQEVTSSDSN